MKYKNILRNILFWIGICFVLWLIVHSWQDIQENLRSVNWPLFCLSVVAAVVGNVIASAIFWNLLLKHNVDVGYQKTIRLFFTAQIAKYIPGKIWMIAHQVSSIQKEGAAVGVVMANVELMIILVAINLLMSVALLLFYSNIFLAVTILLAGVFVVWLLVKFDLLALAIKMFPRFKNDGEEGKSSTGMAFGLLGVASCYAGLIIFYILSYTLMLHSVFGFSIRESAIYIASLALAWVAGLAAFIVPGGIGVREALFMAIAGTMGQGVDVGALAAIAVISRVWLIAQDFVGIGLAQLWVKKTP